MNRLRELRKAKKITQSELAEFLSCDQTTVSYWENKEFNTDTKTAEKLADFFCVTIDYLLGRSDDLCIIPTRDGDDEELHRILEELHKRPELKTLIIKSIKTNKEDVEKIVRIFDVMKDDVND